MGWDGGFCGMLLYNFWLLIEWIDFEEDKGWMVEVSFLKMKGYMIVIIRMEVEI